MCDVLTDVVEFWKKGRFDAGNLRAQFTHNRIGNYDLRQALCVMQRDSSQERATMIEGFIDWLFTEGPLTGQDRTVDTSSASSGGTRKGSKK